MCEPRMKIVNFDFDIFYLSLAFTYMWYVIGFSQMAISKYYMCSINIWLTLLYILRALKLEKN